MSQQLRSANKTQQSISQFFTIKSSQESPLAHRLPTRPEAGSKRPPQQDELDGGSGPGQSAKRQRASSLNERGDDPVPNAASSQSQPAAASSPPPPPPPPPSPPPPSSSRTDQFLLRSSQDHAASQAALEPTEDAVSLRNAELHRRFVQKLGHPESLAHLRDRGRALAGGETPAEDEDEAEAGAVEDGEQSVSPPSKSASGKKRAAKTKLTPMEMQVVDLKRKHSDTLLIVEVGYKFRFFGEDARIAAKELGIMCIPGKLRFDDHPSESHLDRFASASVPVHRLSVHARRLVAAGHKVGVVRQVETAALKKAGANRNAPFVRKLTNVYTKGTYIDEAGELESPAEGGTGSAAGGYLLCLTEKLPRAGGGMDEKVQIGMISVHPATGDIIYDKFEDGFMRSELQTRILHISPCEFLIVGELSGGTAKLIRHLSGSNTNVFGDRSRVETVPQSAAAATAASSRVAQFYADKLGGRTCDDGATTDTGEVDSAAPALLDKVLKLPELVTTCLAAMINHLTEYGLEHVFDLTKNFHSFSARTHMLVTGTTLESLEIYRNSTDYGERGSLFWVVDKTVTPFGRRQLRRWVGRPLLNHDQLEMRLAAVSELHDSRASPWLVRLESLLKGIRTDLERSLIRIYYGRCSRSELVAVLQTFQRIGMHFQHVDSGAATGFASPLIADAICALPPLLGTVLPYLGRVNAEGARKDDKYLFFREGEQTEPMVDHQLGIAAVEQELDAHRTEAAEALSRRGSVQYVTTAGIEYLIEVANPDTGRVPASWVKISGTKKLSRFHTPTVIRLIRERDQHRESLTAACDAAFADFLRSLAAEYQPLRDAVSALATLDCLVSLAKLASLPGYSKPTILPPDAPPQVSISAGRHPVAEHLLPDGYIPFSAAVSSPSPLAYLITGPNMGGKSSFVRAVALLVLLAQIGSFVPAESLSLTLADAIFTRMGARDNIFAGESTFMVELGETARILRAATARSLIVLDELGRGTSTHDGAAIAHAVLDYVVRQPKCLTLFITHYQSLARAADGLGPGLVKNVHMRFTTSAPRARAHGTSGDPDEEEDITFLYELGDGVAHRSYGLNVARRAHIPRRVLDVAQRKSAELEVAMGERRLHSAASLLADVLRRPARTHLDHIVTCIEQL